MTAKEANKITDKNSAIDQSKLNSIYKKAWHYELEPHKRHKPEPPKE